MAQNPPYSPAQSETHWQAAWAAAGCFAAPDDPGTQAKSYVLEMFPYPSGDLHMGHVRNYCIGDVFARFARLQGACVLHPMGWDALGLPAENQAILEQVAPQQRTPKNIARMKQQLMRLGLAYDWKREIATYRPEYYRWNQWFFLQLYARDLVYRRQSQVNFCSGCDTVLANEQVNEARVCWRGHPDVVKRSIGEWAFRITAYAEALLAGLDDLTQWPERILAQQRHWLGKSVGAGLRFARAGNDAAAPAQELEVFTTRLETAMGACAVLLAPDDPRHTDWVTPAQSAAVASFVARMQRTERSARLAETAAKEGVFTGSSVLHPFTGAPLPVVLANYVLADYGSGAVMCVPAHDARDHGLAQAMGLPVRQVVAPPAEGDAQDDATLPYSGPGHLMNSGVYDGQRCEEARASMLQAAQAGGFGGPQTTWHLRDWGFSRQRYWGTPIPIVYCDACGTVPLPLEALPLELPDFADLKLTGTGGAPLRQIKAFTDVPCPTCGAAATREVDTMDTFVDSAWYFARYLSPQHREAPVDPAAAAAWLPVDVYVGGPEHAVMHLLYFRFFTRVMRQLGLCQTDEPVRTLITQGMVNAPSYRCPNHGYVAAAPLRAAAAAKTPPSCPRCAQPLQVLVEKMSKSKLNGVDPLALIDRYGADTTRLYTLFAAPPEKDLEWDPNGVEGISRFVNRLWRLIAAQEEALNAAPSTAREAPSPAAREADLRARHLLHSTLQRVGDELLRRHHFNTAIAALMELVNGLYALQMHASNCVMGTKVRREVLQVCAAMLAPLAPHIAESCWAVGGGEKLVAQARWPAVDAQALQAQTLTLAVQVNGKLRAQLQVPADVDAATAGRLARADAGVQRHVGERPILKEIFIPGRLLNLVVAREG